MYIYICVHINIYIYIYSIQYIYIYIHTYTHTHRHLHLAAPRQSVLSSARTGSTFKLAATIDNENHHVCRSLV